jgi:hypothetical protein
LLLLPEASDGRSDCVPRFALRVLEDHARSEPQARRSLEIAAFGPYPARTPSSGLRAAAVAALCRTADAEGRARIAGFLQSETDEIVLASARSALDPSREED